MVRTIITPNNTKVNLSIPPAYVGRRIEVLYYPVDELVEEKPSTPKNMSSFRGVLSGEEGKELQEYNRYSELERQFDELADKWKEETGFFSIDKDRINNTF